MAQEIQPLKLWAKRIGMTLAGGTTTAFATPMVITCASVGLAGMAYQFLHKLGKKHLPFYHSKRRV